MSSAIDSKLDPADYSASGWGAYGVSKAANVLFTVELERRFEAAGLRASAVALHPGVVQTDLSRYIIGGVSAEDAHPTSEAEAPTGVGAFLKVIREHAVARGRSHGCSGRDGRGLSRIDGGGDASLFITRNFLFEIHNSLTRLMR